MDNLIYKIVNLLNGKFYVGSTTNMKERFRRHRILLRGNRHHCKHLQAAWNKHGEGNFVFVVVETVPPGSNLQTVEDVWLKAHVGQAYCYNKGTYSDAPMRGRSGADHPNFGVPVTLEQRQQISKTLKQYYKDNPGCHPNLGKTYDAAARLKISKGRKGKMAGADHYRYGQTVSDEVRKKIGDTQRGIPKAPRTISPEGHAKIAAAAAAGHYSNLTGRSHTLESRLKISKGVMECTTNTQFTSLTAALEHYGLLMPTLRRALKTGKPLSKGPCVGLTFKYV